MKMKAIVLVTALLAFAVVAQGQKNFIDQNYIEVKGVAEMELVPNEIYLNIHIDEKDTKNKESVEVLEKQMFSALRKAGIKLEKQLSVSDFGSNIKQHFIKKSNVIKSKDFELLVYDTKILAKVFVELEKLKISNIGILRVDHSDIEKFRQEVKIKAIKAGKEKASALCQAIGETVGKAIYINETSSHFKNQYANTSFRIRGASSLAKVKELDLNFQNIKLEYTVLLRFVIK